jgi:putative membrane protein
MLSSLRSSLSTHRKLLLIGLCLFFVSGAVLNAMYRFQPLVRSLTPVVLALIGLTAAFLTYEMSIRTTAALGSVLLLTYLAEAAGVNVGFPFGDFAYTHVLGPMALEVPLVMPLVWLAILIPSWVAAEKILRHKHVVVASIIVTATDAVLELAADSLDLWHWKGGMPTELNYLTWFALSYAALSILQAYAKEKKLRGSFRIFSLPSCSTSSYPMRGFAISRRDSVFRAPIQVVVDRYFKLMAERV